ncbi:MAG TPA: LLM class F420-dependent oxidoreductase [Trebonia sp.]|jgi:F420-dependent oxidoreductase-like protein|nr:LLM class F420-dependent oxidoreductase [Trebonia sp.]
MQIGIHFMNFTLPEGPAGLRSAVGNTAVAAEEAGCAVFTAMDHWFQMEHFADARDPMLEGYSVLSFVAAKTERIRLGLLVTGVTYRHPGLLAKTVATLDVLSGGRATLGIGAAWYEREHLALGVPYPPVAERFERLEEAVQVCEQMWSDEDGPYQGRYYQLGETICEPRPLQRPRPPILIGGGGEKKTLRLVAQYADACNLFATGVDETKRKLDILRGHCDAVGRDYDSIQKTILARVDPAGDVSEFLASMQEYAALGVSLVEVAPTMPDPARFATLLGDKVVRPLAEIG